MNANSLQDKIAAAHYVVTAQQVESVAVAVQTGKAMSTTYLRIVLTAMQAALGSGRKRSAKSQMEVLEKVHEEFMPAVKRGVSFRQDLEPAELHARCGFARVTASAFRRYVKGGGDVRELDPMTLTRRQLSPEADDAVTAAPASTEAIVQRSTARMLRSINKAARRKPAEARQLLETAIAALQAALMELDAPAQTQEAALRATLERPAQRTRVGRTAWKQAARAGA